jgi:hypothetical protein
LLLPIGIAIQTSPCGCLRQDSRPDYTHDLDTSHEDIPPSTANFKPKHRLTAKRASHLTILRSTSVFPHSEQPRANTGGSQEARISEYWLSVGLAWTRCSRT